MINRNASGKVCVRAAGSDRSAHAGLYLFVYIWYEMRVVYKYVICYLAGVAMYLVFAGHDFF